MSAKEKSDLPEVVEKRANKAASAVAELVERRGGAKENAELQSTVRTQSREAVSRAQARIREAVIRNKQDKLTALHSRRIGSDALNLDAEDDKARIKAPGKVWFAVAQAAPPDAARVEQRWRAPWRKNPTVSGRAVTTYRASSAKWARDATRL
jgi:hypothetical protein